MQDPENDGQNSLAGKRPDACKWFSLPFFNPEVWFVIFQVLHLPGIVIILVWYFFLFVQFQRHRFAQFDKFLFYFPTVNGRPNVVDASLQNG